MSMQQFANFDEFVGALSKAVKIVDSAFPQTTSPTEKASLRVLTSNLQKNRYFGALQEVFVQQKAEFGADSENGHLIATENKKFYDFLTERKQILNANMRDCKNVEIRAEVGGNVEEVKNREKSNVQGASVQNEMRNCLKNYEEAVNSMSADIDRLIVSAKKVLLLQRSVRPITQLDIENFVGVLQMRTTYWENQLKMITCNQLMLLKAQFHSGLSQKRRNFTKNATKILNDYFEAHMSEPYPTEQTKLRLAEQCGITVAQVSNWFGNKRIRFRKAFLQNSLLQK